MPIRRQEGCFPGAYSADQLDSKLLRIACGKGRLTIRAECLQFGAAVEDSSRKPVPACALDGQYPVRARREIDMLSPALWAAEYRNNADTFTVWASALYGANHQRDPIREPKDGEEHVEPSHSNGDDRKQQCGKHSSPDGSEDMSANPGGKIKEICPDIDVPLSGMSSPEVLPPVSGFDNVPALVLKGIVNRNRDLMIPRAEKVIPSDSRGSLRMLIDICRVGVLMEQQRFHEAAA